MGELLSGKLIRNATLIATGAGPAFNLGAIQNGQSLVGILNVSAASAGDTLDVVIESDDAEAFSSPTTRLTFAQKVTPGVQQVLVPGPITDTWWRAKATIGGSGPSFTFAVFWAVSGTQSIPDTLPILANLLVWFRADLGITLNGADVAAWADQSVNTDDLAQGTAADQPEYVASAINGKPALRFDGTEFMTNATWDSPEGAEPHTIYAVFKRTSGADEDALSWGTGSADGLRAVGSSGSTFRGNTASDQGGLVSDTSFGVVTERYAGGTDVTLYENGAEATGSAKVTTENTPSATTLTVGKRVGASAFLIGEVAEFAIFSAAHGTSDRQAIERYLGNRYGIAVL